MILAIVTLLLSVFFPWGRGIEGHPVYHLKVRIEPSLSSIEGNVEIEDPDGADFFLTKSLRVLRIMADGKPVSFQSNPSATQDNSFEIVPNAKNPKNLVIKYAGQIKPDSLSKTVSSVNMIKSELVELSNYIDWYPRLKKSAAFRFTLEADVPLHYVTVMGGTLKQEKVRNKRSLTRWEGVEYSITLLAAPNLHKAAITQNGMTVEIYYDKLPSSYVETMKSNLMNAMERLVGLYGKPGDDNLVRVIYSPRSGHGYARNPLILVSEKFALEQLPHRFGPARDLRLNIHEIAHYWSRADTSTPEDWINEGLAEYSALLLSEEIVGKEFSDLLLSEYREIVDNSDSESSIVETSGDSFINREVNRYYKPAILLNEVRQRYGEEKLRQFFKALYERCLEANSATTAIFLEEMEKNIGKEARDYFSEALYRKNWKSAGPLPTYTYSPSDAIFLGRWTGGLTQSGATLKFILNLKVKEEKLVATLDSPDQNVKDIPVEARIKGDSIFLRVRVASATYEGRLDRSQMKIEGEWRQRGIAYPLNLAKEQQPE